MKNILLRLYLVSAEDSLLAQLYLCSSSGQGRISMRTHHQSPGSPQPHCWCKTFYVMALDSIFPLLFRNHVPFKPVCSSKLLAKKHDDKGKSLRSAEEATPAGLGHRTLWLQHNVQPRCRHAGPLCPMAGNERPWSQAFILVPLGQKRGETAGQPYSARTPGVCIGLGLTSNVSQLSSIPSPGPLSSAMQTAWHTLGKGLKASQGCWLTTDLQEPS